MEKILEVNLFVFFILSPFIIFSQGEFDQWRFGNYSGLDFNFNPPVSISGSAMYTPSCPASVSDSLGNLLFYSYGGTIWNKNNQIMQNGSGLYGVWFNDQSVFSISSLSDPNVYFLFYLGDFLFPPMTSPGLFYAIIDMELDGGLGGVVNGTKNIPVPGGENAVNWMSATRHRNCKDIWLIVRTIIPDAYLAYKISSLGIDTIPVVSQSIVNTTMTNTYAGTIKITRDGSKLITCYINDTITEFCYFNNETGEVSPSFTFHTGYRNTFYINNGNEFSIDSRFVYCNALWPFGIVPTIPKSLLIQYDATLNDSLQFIQSGIIIDSAFNNTYTVLQLGPDNKIYTPLWQVDSLGVINNPEIAGSGCNFQKNAIFLNGNVCTYGLPQFLQKYKAFIHHQGTCQYDSIRFSSDIWPPADSVLWNFGDPSSGSANFSNDTIPSHVYNLPGQYIVKLFVRYVDNRNDTSRITITIDETPDPNLGPNQSICQGDSITIDAGACPGCTFEWTSIPSGFSSTEQTVTLNQSGIYIVAVTSTSGCTGRDTMQLIVTAPPIIINTPLSKSICSGEVTNIPITANLPGTSFSWTATGSSPLVFGYGTGTGDTIDQVLTNIGATSETVTYTITPSIGSCQGDSAQYVVTVTPGDSVLVSISASADSICEGIQVTYTATPVQGGSAPSYQWKVNGTNQGTNNPVFTYSPSNDDTVCCILSSSDTVCISNNPATSNEISLTVYPDLTVNISISTTNNPVCEGSTATFAASTSNKGASPNFQWVVNGNPIGTNDSIFAYSPSNGDQVISILTSSEQCSSNNPATSDTITMIVNPLLPVGISISASNNPVCEGLPVTFTGAAINGGSTPAYQWQVNGINTGTNNPDFTYTPVDGDFVTCTLTSNVECVSNNPATSNSITMSVGEAPDVSFTICFDTITTLNAKPFKLKGGIPLGGIYSGPGVDQISGYFNPAMAGVGLKTISYSYTNLFNCSNNATRAISVINPAQFSCGDSLIDIRDNKKYPTVQIGSQCWLAVNLNYGSKIPGDQSQRDNCIPEKYCYNDLPANCTQYGALYQWDELMSYEDAEEIQGLCPLGWHVPSEADWNLLFAVYQGSAFAGRPLLYTGYSGFNVLLAGVEFFNQSHRFADFASIIWSSTSHGPYKAWSHGLNGNNYSVSYYPSYRSNAFSVRCVRE